MFWQSSKAAIELLCLLGLVIVIDIINLHLIDDFVLSNIYIYIIYIYAMELLQFCTKPLTWNFLDTKHSVAGVIVISSLCENITPISLDQDRRQNY